jgi:hypothetical protein
VQRELGAQVISARVLKRWLSSSREGTFFFLNVYGERRTADVADLELPRNETSVCWRLSVVQSRLYNWA